MSAQSQMVCTGCDEEVPESQFLSFACPNAGSTEKRHSDTDHVLRAKLPLARLVAAWPDGELSPNDNPFLRYRKLSHTYQLAARTGMTDDVYVSAVRSLTAAVEEVDGRALQITPLQQSSVLNTLVKNETVNISGSHKARHLIGTALHLEIASQLGVGGAPAQPLAIASCGNAALAAAVVAKAAKRSLKVYVPPWADDKVKDRLRELGAEQIVCERRDSDPPGDPCYLRFREAVAAGALPFSCQGGDNALALLGGHNLGWELIEQSKDLRHLFIQVGGGALASSIIQAFAMAKDAGIVSSLPRFHAVQTDNAHPLARAWQTLQSSGDSLSQARLQRSKYMWPWESEPKSVASGILDDETYDWFSIASGLSASGGSVVTVSEARLVEAQSLGQEKTGIAVDATGTAGLAGLLELRSRGQLPSAETSAVLFTGAIR